MYWTKRSRKQLARVAASTTANLLKQEFREKKPDPHFPCLFFSGNTNEWKFKPYC